MHSNQSYGVRKQNLIIHQNIVTQNDLLHIYQVADSHESIDVARRRGCHSCWLFMYILYGADRCHFGNKSPKLNRVSEIYYALTRSMTFECFRLKLKWTTRPKKSTNLLSWFETNLSDHTKNQNIYMSKCCIQTGSIADRLWWCDEDDIF